MAGNSSVIFLVIAIIIVGVLVFLAMMLAGKRGHKFNVEKYQTQWLAIENGLQQGNTASYSLAIINADKLLDEALKELRIPGQTMGERLKRSGSRFSQLNNVWAAHKMRNQIAHEAGFTPEYKQARFALASFRQALKDLGAI